ncbi:MAG: ArsA-related P-loop ATPase [Myxococcota bacterium]
MNETSADILNARLIVSVGPGGVGKTSTSAAMALAAARRGRRVALLTIDPARRLADALGIDRLDDTMRPVVPLPPVATGLLEAAMLDTKQSFDRLIGRLTARAPGGILDNRVYRAFSRTLARSHAYVAMERLHELMAEPRYDLVVLDTPPLRSALEILDAPARLRAFLDEKVLAAFFGPGLVGRGARGSSAMAGRLLSLVAGRKLVGDLLGFFQAFMPLREGFATRAGDTERTLRAPTTAFVLVTAPEPAHLGDAGYLRAGLDARGLRPALTIFNRAFVPGPTGTPVTAAPGPTARLELAERLAPDGTIAERQAIRRSLDLVAAIRDQVATRNTRSQRALEAFARPGDPAVKLPALDQEPVSPAALLALWDERRPVDG